MTPITDMVRKMMAAGASNELILIALEGHELAFPVENPAEKRLQRIREYDRNRKRNGGNSSGIPVDPPERPSLSIVSTSLKKKVSKEERERRGTRCPVEMTLPEDWRLGALSKGLTEGEIGAEFIKFKNYWGAKPGYRGLSLDWKLNWATWCTNFLNYQGRAATTDPSIPQGLTPEQLEDWRGGWRPGMRSSEEIRNEVERTEMGKIAPLVQDRLRPRDAQQGVVGTQTRKPGVARLDGILRQTGMDAASIAAKRANGGTNPGYDAQPMAGMATSDPRDHEEGEA